MMQIITDLDDARLSGPSVFAIGNFDGLHRGHQALLAVVRSAAQGNFDPPAASGILTFSPHPLHVLRPEVSHALLTTPEERLALAAALGIDLGVILPFTLALARLDPRSFMAMLTERLGLAGLIVGPDFALGRNRVGDIAALSAIGEELGYWVSVVDPLQWQEQPVRSSVIRQQLRDGSVAEAAELLGRPYRVTGIVVPGDRRGRQIGVPTANLQTPPDILLPADGVYVTRTAVHDEVGAASLASVTNLGLRPTVDGAHRRLETHLLDYPPPADPDALYGRTLSIDFLARLRSEERFTGIEALVAQIRQDIERARRRFAELH